MKLEGSRGLSLALRDQLAAWLKDCSKIAILGIGNPLRGDDAVGMEIVKLLKGKVPMNVELLECETVPENFTRQIREFNPTHVLMIDAAQFEAEPGEARLVPPEKILGMTLSTHAIPLSMLAEVIKDSINAKVMILGVQPQKIEFGEGLTPELQKASKRIAGILAEALNQFVK
jgi:hydrogenase 3 maturation protease